MQDNGGVLPAPGDDTVNPAITSTVTVAPVNDEPTLTATATNPTFTEGNGPLALFNSAAANAIEAAQTFDTLVLTVTNVGNGASEKLTVDGTVFDLVAAGPVATGSGYLVSISVLGSTATVTIDTSPAAASGAQIATLVDGLAYQNISDDPTVANRVVTIASLQDSGGVLPVPGDDTVNPVITSTVTVAPVNDEPTLTATAINPAFTEGNGPLALFNSAAANAIEAAQTFDTLVLTVTNVGNGASEKLTVDGTVFDLVAAGPVATGSGYLVSISVLGSTATVTIDTSPASANAAAIATLVDGLAYQNISDDPSALARVVTIESLQDDGGVLPAPGDDTVNPAITSTVTLVAINSEPTLTAIATNPVFTEGDGALALFNSAAADAIEAAQSFDTLVLTVTNVTDGTNEKLTVDGTVFDLVAAGPVATGSGYLVSIGVVGSTATVTIDTSPASANAAAIATLVDGLAYQNISDDPSALARVVTIESLQDDGGVLPAPGDDTVNPAITSTVTLVAVNSEPTLTATATNPTFTEGNGPLALFNSAAANAIEAAQTFDTLVLTVTNVGNGTSEKLTVDGTVFDLVAAGPIATGSGYLVSIGVVGSTATVTIDTSPASANAAAIATLVDGLAYQNISDDPTVANRVVTIESLQDNGGVLPVPGDDTVNPVITSTVTVAPVNDEPTLTAIGTDPTFTEGDGALALFNSTAAAAIEAAQTFDTLVLTVTNVGNGASEKLTVDGTVFDLVAAGPAATGSGYLVSISVLGSTATVTIDTSPAAASGAQIATLVDGLAYQNISDDPTVANRVVTIASLQDSGGVLPAPGDDTVNPVITSTVTVAPVNDEPTLTATAINPAFTEGNGALALFNSAAANAIEAAQTFDTLVLTVTNVGNGASEKLTVDGTVFDLVAAGPVATGSGYLVSISVLGSTATVTIDTSPAAATGAQIATLVDGLAYQNISDDPSALARVVTIESLQDNGGVLPAPGDDTVNPVITSTVTLVAINSEPTLTATATNPVFTEGDGALALFNSAAADAIEAAQSFDTLVLTVTNVTDGTSEKLTVDGTVFDLVAAGPIATGSGYLVSIGVVGSTATVTIDTSRYPGAHRHQCRQRREREAHRRRHSLRPGCRRSGRHRQRLPGQHQCARLDCHRHHRYERRAQLHGHRHSDPRRWVGLPKQQ